MWLEIKVNGAVKLLNTRHVTYVAKAYNSHDLILFLVDKKEFHIKCDSDNDCAALIQGLILALNGLDFKIEGADDETDVYIKPLKDDANESLYKYMKLKELLGDRK